MKLHRYLFFNNNCLWRIANIILAVAGLTACSNAVESTNLPKDPGAKSDNTAPTWTATPDNSSLLAATGLINIRFSEPMDTASLQLSEELANEVGQPSWGTTNHVNDTLVLSPDSQWSDGLQRSIRVEATDKAGNASAPVTLTYDIDTRPPVVTNDPPYKISNTPVTVTLTCDDGQGTGCDAIYYTVDGVTIPKPDNSSLLYTGPVRIDTTTRLKYIGVDKAGVVSNYVSGWYTIDMQPPIGDVITTSPDHIIGSVSDIEIQFSETMDVNSLSLSGSMSAEIGVIEWVSDLANNDYLILHPANDSNWSLGAGATLFVAAQDLAGNALGTSINLTYDIGTIHVNASDVNASDANTGTRASPKLTIQSAISAARALPGPSQVLVAQGVYSASSLVFTGINLVEQVSLFGGYADDWSTRNPLTYVTTITPGTLTVDPASIFLDPVSWAIAAGSGITWRTVVNGFAIDGGNGTNPVGPTSAMYIAGGAGPTIRGNVISGGDVKGRVYGVYIDNAAPTLDGNTVNGTLLPTAAPVTSYSHAIFVTTNADPIIKNNTINGGSAVTQSVGIELYLASAIIRNNNINGGSADVVNGVVNTNSTIDLFNNVLANSEALQNSNGITLTSAFTTNIFNNIINPGSASNMSTGLALQGGSYPTVKNNIFTNGTCILEVDIGSNPVLVENNDLFNCLIPYYDADAGCINDLDGDGVANTCNTEEMNTLTNMANNLSVDPQWQNPANSDYHFTTSSPTSVTENAIDLSYIFTTDKDGVLRTDPWSIGAYEQDP